MVMNYTSCDVIIAKVMSDLDIQEEGQRITDMREWIFEAIEKIGAVTQYAHKESATEDTPVLKIHNYQSPLPDDLHGIDMVAYSTKVNGPWMPMRSNTGSFRNYPDKGNVKQLIDKGAADDNIIYPTVVPVAGNRNTTNFVNDHQYSLKPGYIVTNRRDGYIKLSYTAIVTDDRGYPLVPSAASYQEAVYWYIVMKLKYPHYLNKQIDREAYYDIKRSWNFYRKQAYAEAIMPTSGDMISIKNNWLKLVPEINEEDTFYSGVGVRQNIYNDYYGRVY